MVDNLESTSVTQTNNSCNSDLVKSKSSLDQGQPLEQIVEVPTTENGIISSETVNELKDVSFSLGNWRNFQTFFFHWSTLVPTFSLHFFAPSISKQRMGEGQSLWCVHLKMHLSTHSITAREP